MTTKFTRSMSIVLYIIIHSRNVGLHVGKFYNFTNRSISLDASISCKFLSLNECSRKIVASLLSFSICMLHNRQTYYNIFSTCICINCALL